MCSRVRWGNVMNSEAAVTSVLSPFSQSVDRQPGNVAEYGVQVQSATVARIFCLHFGYELDCRGAGV
jgi:hypothetical protein